MPDQQGWWSKISNAVDKLAASYGFSKIETPLIEQTKLFERSVGENTDIVQKEMYTLKTKGGDLLCLRPEGTAPIVRAYLENGLFELPHPLKLYYFGPMFRYERPQFLRYRQFWQFGFEIIGDKNPILDAQLIQLSFNIFRNLGLGKVFLKINSIGCSQCRRPYKKILVNFYKKRLRGLCPDCKKRLKTNPLRLLDCKEPKCQENILSAPATIDYLCEECRQHFKNVLEFLDEINLPYFLEPRLARGLDYYTKTVFEIFEKKEGKKEKTSQRQKEKEVALGGGGRYDDLVEILGGESTPAVGAAFGIERIIHLLKKEKISPPNFYKPKVFLAQLGDLARKKGLVLFEKLLKEGISAAEAFSKESLKAQLKTADKLKVKFALILGQQEALNQKIILRDMETASQEEVPLEKIIQELKKKLKK